MRGMFVPVKPFQHRTNICNLGKEANLACDTLESSNRVGSDIIHKYIMENVRQVVARVVLSVFMRKYFIFRVSFFKPSIKIVSAGKY